MIAGRSCEKGPMKSVTAAIKEMSIHILEEQSEKNVCVKPAFPRMLYKWAVEMGWRHQIKANGLKTKDLFRQK